jgi:hypothetical protein
LSVPAAFIAQRRDHHRHAALVVARPRTDPAVAPPLPALEGMVRFEHSIEMADQEHALAPAVALVGRDDVAGAPGAFHVDPVDLEAQRLKLRTEHPPDRFDARRVQAPAVLVHPGLKHGDGPLLLGVNRLDHGLLRRRKRGGGRGGEE